MYIGEDSNPNHLLFEILDNSLDEAQAGFCCAIGVQIDNKNHVATIADNGRGIPFQNNTIEIIATTLNSGGKFEKGDGGVYGIATGLHGIGLVAVTALSEWVEIDVYRDGSKVHYRFENAQVVDSTIEQFEGKAPFSTQISFKPDKKYFQSVKFNITPIHDRLNLASIHIKKLALLFSVDDKKEVIKFGPEEFFNTELLSQSSEDKTKTFLISNKVKDEFVVFRFCWDFDSASTSKCIGCVNLLRVDQGTHINYAMESVRNAIWEIAESEKINIQKQDTLVGLRAFVSVALYHAKYSSQTKEKLVTAKKDLSELFECLKDRIKSQIISDPELKDRLLSFFLKYRKRQSAKSNIVKTGKTVSRLNSVVDSKLRDCTTHKVEDSELFIVEGASAGGGLLKCRDPKIHALLCLKGKVPNIADSKKDFFKNKEILEIINALGTGIDPDFDIEGIRYGKIIIATDADPDGSHIAVLLMTAFLRMVPQLVKDNFLYMAKMPLYGSVVNGKFLPLYSEGDVSKFHQDHPKSSLQRYKGLGEMNPDQLAVCLLDDQYRKLIPVPFPSSPSDIFKLMLSADLKRKLV